MSLSTHVLDAVRGRPAVGLAVLLESELDGAWAPITTRFTDEDGRIADLAGELPVGVHRLTFRTELYLDVPTFYPEVVITFRVTDAAEHHHVPLLLSPFAYSTYRGS